MELPELQKQLDVLNKRNYLQCQLSEDKTIIEIKEFLSVPSEPVIAKFHLHNLSFTFLPGFYFDYTFIENIKFIQTILFLYLKK